MLSLNHCRNLLGAESEILSDHELEALREQLYGLASLMILHFKRTPPSARPVGVANFSTALDSLSENERMTIEERAAVIEFDGNFPRDDAERAAIIMTLDSNN